MTYRDTPDTPGRTLSVTYLKEPGFMLTPESGTLTLRIRDNDPTMVRLIASEDTYLKQEGQMIRFRVQLSRALVAGETIIAPLRIDGVSSPATDFLLTLGAGATNTGVALDTGVPTHPEITFSGTGARTAVLEFSLLEDGETEPGAETITVALASDSSFDSESETNVGGGADPEMDGGSTKRFRVQAWDSLPFVQFRSRPTDATCATGSDANWVVTGEDDPAPTTLHEGGADGTYQYRLVDELDRPFFLKSLQLVRGGSSGPGNALDRDDYMGPGGPDRARFMCHAPVDSRGRSIGQAILWDIWIPRTPTTTSPT